MLTTIEVASPDKLQYRNESAATTTAQVLRPYQAACVDAIQDSWGRGKTPLAWLATGGGKTTILSELLVRQIDPEVHRALVFAHTKEIIEQITDRVRNQFDTRLKPYYGPTFAPGIGIVMGTNDSPDARIVVATRQSLHPKRLARVLQTGAFDVVMIDEGHHVSPDNTYSDIIRALREVNPHVKVAGMTATPKRTDKRGLGVLFDEICYRWTILDGIQGGYLAPATRIKIQTAVNVSNVRTKEGDYDQQQLIGVLDANNWITLCVDAYKDYGQGRQTLAFFPKVDMSREFVRRLNEAGISAAHIDATTPKESRTDILRRYQRGELRIVSNFGVLTEGFDNPATSAILLARPTRSETLFTQIIGRGLRMYPGKSDCLIIDMTVVDTKALEVGTILGQMADCHVCGTQFWKGLKQCPQCGADVHEESVNTKECPACGLDIPRTARICPECGYVIPNLVVERPNKGTGTGLRAEYASLFSQVQSAWHVDKAASSLAGVNTSDGWFSVSLGFDNSAFVIAPPSYAGNGDRLRERIGRGWHMLPILAGENTDPELIAELEAQIAQLEREAKRIDQYSLYYLPSVPKDPVTGREQNHLAPDPVYLRSNADLAALMTEADAETHKYGQYTSAIDRDASWRGQLASEGQISYLKRLGYKKSELPPDLDKGSAAEMITHKKSVARVIAWLETDKLSDPNPPQRTDDVNMADALESEVA